MAKRISCLPGTLTIAVKPELDNSTLKVRVQFTRDLRPFFVASDFFLRYEDDITAGDELLGVTAVALLLPLAWLTGSNIRVGKLDRTFGQAAEALQHEFSAIYPKVPFGTRLIVDEWIDSPPNPDGVAMLYSGGLDATYSFFANRARRPRLIQVFGTEFPISEAGFLGLARDESSGFAKRNGVPISFIHTDFFDMFEARAVMHRFWLLRERLNGDLWKGMGYALGFLAMAAPLSAGRFNHLIIAAWANQEHANRMRENPDSSSPRVDEKIKWSNLEVEHHGCLHRCEKTRAMKEWFPGNVLRVCWNYKNALEAGGALNCNHCEKCARSIVALAIGGVDPERCGFRINQDTVDYMMEMLTSGTIRKSHLVFWWGSMQREIPENLEGEMFGLRKFLEWFRCLDLGNGLDPPPSVFSISYWYNRFPYPVSRTIRSTVFGLIGKRRT
jgi:hypothetical protein